MLHRPHAGVAAASAQSIWPCRMARPARVHFSLDMYYCIVNPLQVITRALLCLYGRAPMPCCNPKAPQIDPRPEDQR